MGAVSYSPFIVTMALSCISSEIKTNIGRKSWFFHTPLAFDAPVRGVPVVILASRLLWGYPMVKNFEFKDMYNHLDSIPGCDRRTDRQTDRRADILPRHRPRYAYASRGKNHPIFMKFCTQQQILHWMNVTWSKMNKLHWTDSEFDSIFLFTIHHFMHIFWNIVLN